MSEIRNWHYIDGPRRVGPFDDSEWAALIRDGVVRPETRVWNEALESWVPYSTIADRFPLPEPEPLPDPEPEPARPTGAEATPEAVEALETQALGDDFRPSVRACLGRSWQLYRAYAAILSGGTMLIWLMVFIGSSLPGGLGLLMPLGLSGTLHGGLYLLYLRLFRGEPAPLGTLFSGFRRGIFRNLVMRTLTGTMVNYLSLFAIVLTLRILGLELGGTTDPTALMEEIAAFFNSLDNTSFLTLLLLFFVCLLPALFLKLFWVFATPLINDRGLPWAAALRLSWRKVQQHPFGIARLIAYSALVASAPALVATLLMALIYPGGAPAVLAMIGVLFSLPLFIGSLMALYETVFPREGAGARLQEEAPHGS